MGDLLNGNTEASALLLARRKEVQQAVDAIKALVPPGTDLATLSATQVQNLLAGSLSNLVPLSEKGAANGVASLDGAGKIPVSQLPALSITETFTVASEAAMLALSAERGDLAIRTDVAKTYVLAADDATVLANWKEMLLPAAGVTQVFGRPGPMVLAQPGDYTAAQVLNDNGGSSLAAGNLQSAIDELDAKIVAHVHPRGRYHEFAGAEHPGVANTIVAAHVVPFPMTLDVNESVVATLNAPDTSVSFSVMNGNTAIGTVTFPVSGSSAVVSFSAPALNKGDVVKMVQANYDASLGKILWSFGASF